MAPSVASGLDPALEAQLRRAEPCFWANPGRRPLAELGDHLAGCVAGIAEADGRLRRCAPLLARIFPELEASRGIIESALVPVPVFARRLAAAGLPVGPEQVLVKADHELPVSGSVKARGGIHAVLAIAESVAREEGLLDGAGDDRLVLAGARARDVFAGYTVSVGSTGNLGMSIGIAGRALGFRVVVHMSSDAKAWKKDRLRGLGATVVEHRGDYLAACASARDEAARDPRCRFIDDENSDDLFHGYAVAGRRLADQLAAMGLIIGPDRPLVLHLPCGVGGAPGGIAVGVRLALGDAALCLTAEPVQAPCMLLGLASGRHDGIAATDLGLHGRTIADGLAVARPSRFVGRMIASLLDGCATADDRELCGHVAALHRDQGLRLEPSAAAGVASLRLLLGSPAGRDLHRRLGATLAMDRAVHVLWATGGARIPDGEFRAILEQAE